MYLASSDHLNLKKNLPEEPPPPEPSKGLKVAICIRGNVSGEFKSRKPEKRATTRLPGTMPALNTVSADVNVRLRPRT
jgi:hypothetical protein